MPYFRLQIPPQSLRHFPSIARRLGRIFAHAYFHHREAFEQAEAESSLYARFLALTSKYDLVPAEFLVIPPRLASMSDDENMGRPSNLLDSHTYLKPDSHNTLRGYGTIESESVVDLSLSDEDRGPSPGGVRGVSPRRSRNRTGTMVHSEALSAAEELSRGGLEEATLSRHKASDVARAINVALAEANAQDQADAVLPPEETPKESSHQLHHEPTHEAESLEAVDIKVEGPSPSITKAVLEEPTFAPVHTLEIAAPPPAEPGVPPADETEDITEVSLEEEIDAPTQASKPEADTDVLTDEPESAPTTTDLLVDVSEPQDEADEPTKSETVLGVEEELKTVEVEAKVESSSEASTEVAPSGMALV